MIKYVYNTILKLSYDIHLINAKFNLIKKQLWIILFVHVSNLQFEFIFGSYELVGAKSLALYSRTSVQPCGTVYNTHYYYILFSVRAQGNTFARDLKITLIWNFPY